MAEDAFCPYCHLLMEDCGCPVHSEDEDRDYGREWDIPDGDGYES
jgi:hypothetical protein